jgi:hypothetical protein
MSREVCGICWGTYDSTGRCECKLIVRDDEALLRRAMNEWWAKTEWVQETAQPHELGMHRADVLAMRLDRAVNSLAEAHCAYQAKLAKDEALLRQALEALMSHGAHAPMCDYLVLLTSLPPRRKPCSCGLHDTIAALRERLGEKL